MSCICICIITPAYSAWDPSWALIMDTVNLVFPEHTAENTQQIPSQLFYLFLMFQNPQNQIAMEEKIEERKSENFGWVIGGYGWLWRLNVSRLSRSLHNHAYSIQLLPEKKKKKNRSGQNIKKWQGLHSKRRQASGLYLLLLALDADAHLTPVHLTYISFHLLLKWKYYPNSLFSTLIV